MILDRLQMPSDNYRLKIKLSLSLINNSSSNSSSSSNNSLLDSTLIKATSMAALKLTQLQDRVMRKGLLMVFPMALHPVLR